MSKVLLLYICLVAVFVDTVVSNHRQPIILLTRESPSSSRTTIDASLGCLRLPVPKLKPLLLEVEVAVLEKLCISVGPLPCNARSVFHGQHSTMHQLHRNTVVLVLAYYSNHKQPHSALNPHTDSRSKHTVQLSLAPSIFCLLAQTLCN